MRTERSATRELAVVVAAALLASGCVSSFASDVRRVGSSTATELPREVLESVDPATDEAVSRALREPLTADAAARIAIANHRGLRATLRELGIERGLATQAGLLPNPRFELDFRQSQDPTQPLQIDLYAEYDLTHALLTPLRAAAAGHDLEAARQRAAGQVLATAYEARVAFHSARAAERRLVFAQRALEALAASRDAAQALFDAGNIAELDLATRIVAYEEARAETAMFELERADARERLHRALGLHGRDTTWAISEAVEPLPEDEALPESVERATLEASFELAELRSRLEASAQRAGLARAEGWLPDVTVDVHAEQDGNAWEAGAGASFTLPIFDRREGETAAHEARFDGLMERYVGLAVDLRSAARAGRNRLASMRLRARQYDGVIVPARRRVYEQTMLQYDAMQVGVFDVIAALRRLLAAELDAVTAHRDYWIARAAMDALLRGQRVGLASPAGAGMSSEADTGGGH
ncbi:MAG: TolC family protein [Sandaracinaceae bacterium]|nr:TolC family protein [Sandaracinaceae bacterium]